MDSGNQRSTARYAIYFAPGASSPLHDFGSRWLGRDAITGQDMAGYSVAGFSTARARELTEAPRHYGFHATLKPPFHLANGAQPDELFVAVRSLASEIAPFSLKALELRWLSTFLALVPSEHSTQLSYLADECVRRFDGFREPPSEEELAKRRSAGLTCNQLGLLERWGYPYVMEEFRFHMSLTGPMRDAQEKDRIFSAAEVLTCSHRRSPLEITSVCVFKQESRETHFFLAQRFKLLGCKSDRR